MTEDAQALIAELLGDVEAHPGLGVAVPPDRLVAFATALKERLEYRFFVYVVATHLPTEDGDRFMIAYRVRRFGTDGGTVAFHLELDDQTPCPSLARVWAGADWQEREQYDLVGVHFAGHPDLRRIMMPDDWKGHPLRRDYAIDTPHFPWR